MLIDARERREHNSIRGGITYDRFREVIRDREFIDGELDTGFIGRFNERRAHGEVTDAAAAEQDIALIAAALAFHRATTKLNSTDIAGPQSKWKMSVRGSSGNGIVRARPHS